MSPGAPRVWVTRAEPGAGRTAHRLRRLGFQPIVAKADIDIEAPT